MVCYPKRKSHKNKTILETNFSISRLLLPPSIISGDGRGVSLLRITVRVTVSPTLSQTFCSEMLPKIPHQINAKIGFVKINISREGTFFFKLAGTSSGKIQCTYPGRLGIRDFKVGAKCHKNVLRRVPIDLEQTRSFDGMTCLLFSRSRSTHIDFQWVDRDLQCTSMKSFNLNSYYTCIIFRKNCRLLHWFRHLTYSRIVDGLL